MGRTMMLVGRHEHGACVQGSPDDAPPVVRRRACSVLLEEVGKLTVDASAVTLGATMCASRHWLPVTLRPMYRSAGSWREGRRAAA